MRTDINFIEHVQHSRDCQAPMIKVRTLIDSFRFVLREEVCWTKTTMGACLLRMLPIHFMSLQKERRLTHIEFKQVHVGCFDLCGRQYEQKLHLFLFSCRENAEVIGPITFSHQDRNSDVNSAAGEISKLRSVVDSCSWMKRQCRLDFLRLLGHVTKCDSDCAGVTSGHLQCVIEGCSGDCKTGSSVSGESIRFAECADDHDQRCELSK